MTHSFFSDAAPFIHHIEATFPAHSLGFLVGAYDFFNAGHSWSLQLAKEQCELLAVALLPDATLQQQDGIPRPVQPLPERAELLLGTQYVDFVVELSFPLLPLLQKLNRAQVLEMVSADGTKPIFQEMLPPSFAKKIQVPLDEKSATAHGILKVCEKLKIFPSRALNLHAGYSPSLPKDPKIIFPNQLQTFLQAQRKQSSFLITTNGSFDLLHPGHVRYLQEAKAQQGTLLVLVNDDASIQKNKGAERPIFSQMERMTALSLLGCVDFVLPFHGDTPLEFLEAIQPALHIKGGSFEAERIAQEKKLVEAHGGKFQALDLIGNFSSTHLLERFKNPTLLSRE